MMHMLHIRCHNSLMQVPPIRVQLSARRFVALGRTSLWWMTPAWGSRVAQVSHQRGFCSLALIPPSCALPSCPLYIPPDKTQVLLPCLSVDRPAPPPSLPLCSPLARPSLLLPELEDDSPGLLLTYSLLLLSCLPAPCRSRGHTVP